MDTKLDQCLLLLNSLVSAQPGLGGTRSPPICNASDNNALTSPDVTSNNEELREDEV